MALEGLLKSLYVLKSLVVGRGRGPRGLFRNKVTYFFLNDPPSTLLSRYLSNSASLFTASGDTFGAFGKQINITLMLSRLPWWKRKNYLRMYTHQSILHTKFHKSYGIRIQLLLLQINIIISLNFPPPFYIFHKSAHSFSTTFKSLCSLLFHGLEPITDSSLPFKNWHY